MPEADGGLDDAWIDRMLGLPPGGDDGPPPAAGLDVEAAARAVGELGLGLRVAGVAARARRRGLARVRKVPVEVVLTRSGTEVARRSLTLTARGR